MSASFDYSPLQDVALELINQFGRDIELRHPTIATITTRAVFLDAELNLATPGAQRRRDGGSSQESNAFYLIPDVGVELSNTWFVADGGVRQSINRVQTIRPGPVIVASQLYVGA